MPGKGCHRRWEGGPREPPHTTHQVAAGSWAVSLTNTQWDGNWALLLGSESREQEEEDSAFLGGNNDQKGYKSGRGVAGTQMPLLRLLGNERGEREGGGVMEG